MYCLGQGCGGSPLLEEHILGAVRQVGLALYSGSKSVHFVSLSFLVSIMGTGSRGLPNIRKLS